MSAEYVINDQLHTARLDASGRNAVNGWLVQFRDAITGVTGEVFVDDDHYTPANVQQLIRAQLETIRAVHSLTD